MREKRKKRFWKLPYTINLINYSLIAMLILNITIFYFFITFIKSIPLPLVSFVKVIGMLLAFVILDIVFLGVLLVFTDRALGALPRIESTLKKVCEGEYNLRIKVRKNDFLRSLAEEVNKLIALLEKKSSPRT